MTEPIHKGKDLLPVWVIHAASGGDSEAMEQVLRYYDDYMSRLCTRTLYDKDGTPHVCVDRNSTHCVLKYTAAPSPPARVAWIEMVSSALLRPLPNVIARKVWRR